MQRTDRKAFTVVEIIISIMIVTMIMGVVLFMMTRGASNVQKGSFNALAANQAFWIISTIRDDFSHSDLAHIKFDSPDTWTGNSTFEVFVEGGVASYHLEDNGKNKTFVRKFKRTPEHVAYEPKEKPRQKFGDEYLTNMTVTKKVVNDTTMFEIFIEMKNPNKTASGKLELQWSAAIYPNLPNKKDEFWVSTVDDPS